MPLYKALKRQICEALTKGVWRPGEAIDSENVMRQTYGVSIGTIRKAIDELVAENILVRHQGRGTFVVSHDSERYFFTFFRIKRQNGQLAYPKVELLQFECRKSTLKTAKALGIGVTEKVYFFVNRLSLDGKIALIDEITVPAEYFKGMSADLLQKRNSTIYSFYQQAFGVSVVRTKERIRAIAAKPPYAQWLGLPDKHPLLLIIRLAYTYYDRPVELRYSYVHPNEHEYIAEPVTEHTGKP